MVNLLLTLNFNYADSTLVLHQYSALTDYEVLLY